MRGPMDVVAEKTVPSMITVLEDGRRTTRATGSWRREIPMLTRSERARIKIQKMFGSERNNRIRTNNAIEIMRQAKKAKDWETFHKAKEALAIMRPSQ